MGEGGEINGIMRHRKHEIRNNTGLEMGRERTQGKLQRLAGMITASHDRVHRAPQCHLLTYSLLK